MEQPDQIRPGRYRHFKGNEYEVLFVARHSETLEPMVVYRRCLHNDIADKMSGQFLKT